MSTPALDDTAALGDFIDGIMKAHIEQLHIPGAVVAVVKNGRVLYAKGYGHQDIAKNIPVDPAKSLFRIGSTSKLFTWTAVMQLVEQGKLDLDGDVNSYLKTFKIPDKLRQADPHPRSHDALRRLGRRRARLPHHRGFVQVEPIATTLQKHMPDARAPARRALLLLELRRRARGTHRRAGERRAVQRVHQAATFSIRST